MSQPHEHDHGPLRYADPGYLPDGHRRLPLTSRADVRAARDWIDSRGAARYTAAQRKRIRDRIRRARLYVAPDISQEQLDTLSEWAAAAVWRLREMGTDPDPWLIGTLPDGRGAAQMWARSFDFPAL